MTNRLQDGEPLTYDLINSMLESISELEKDMKGDNDQRQNIVVSGKANEKAGKYSNLDSNNILIRSGVIALTPSEIKGNLRRRIHFGEGNKSVGFNGPPIVVACLADDDDDKLTPYASLIVSKVDKTGFTLKLNLLSKIEDEIEIIVNYIAIGAYNRQLKT